MSQFIIIDSREEGKAATCVIVTGAEQRVREVAWGAELHAEPMNHARAQHVCNVLNEREGLNEQNYIAVPLDEELRAVDTELREEGYRLATSEELGWYTNAGGFLGLWVTDAR